MFVASREGIYEVEPEKNRSLGGLISASLIGSGAGLLVSISLMFGLLSHFPIEQWGFIFWGDHVVLRVVGSMAAAAGGGVIAGLVAGRYGVWVGVASALPAFTSWALVSFGAWTGNWAFFTFPIALPAGGRLVATLVPLLVLPVAAMGGRVGVRIRERNEGWLAVRRGLLGIPLRHYFWLPLFALAILTHAAWATLIAWRTLEASASGDLVRFLLLILTAIGFVLLWRGAKGVYTTLASRHPTVSVGGKFRSLLKYGIGFPLGAWILHVGALTLLGPR